MHIVLGLCQVVPIRQTGVKQLPQEGTIQGRRKKQGGTAPSTKQPPPHLDIDAIGATQAIIGEFMPIVEGPTSEGHIWPEAG